MASRFKKFALAATAATYFQIFIGGLVRVSGAGLGCPDWPTCFGRWFPPTDVSQLPADIDPAQFNFVLAWIEYVNRLIGMVVGLLIAGTAIWALIAYRKHPRILLPAVLSAFLVAYVGWQGGQMIEAELKSLMVSAHMGLAFILAALMTYVAYQAYRIDGAFPPVDLSEARPYRIWVIAIIVISVVQVVLGTQVRSALEHIAATSPLLPQGKWLGQVGDIHTVHALLGIAVTLISWQIGAKILRHIPREAILIRHTTWAVILIATVQVILGGVLVLAGVPDLMQLYHLLMSALYLAALLILLAALSEQRRAA
jgi:cytochrome c oxidase assembly protein subunit 15